MSSAFYIGETKISNVGLVINSEGLDTSDATMTEDGGLEGLTFYAKGEKHTGNIPTKTSGDITVDGAITTIPAGYYRTSINKRVATAEQATPTITISDEGLITATATQTEGYVTAGTESATQQLETIGNILVTPSKSSQEVTRPGTYNTGSILVTPIPSSYITTSDATAAASDIKSGKTAYVNGEKITGTHTESAGLDTSDATATAADMLNGKTAYVNGAKVTGTIPAQAAKTITPSNSTQTAIAAGTYASGDVTVAAIPSKYVDTTDITKTANDVTVNATTVTIPSGYYNTQVKKIIDLAEVSAETSMLDGLVDVAYTINKPGYLASTDQIQTFMLEVDKQEAKTITPSSSEQVAVAAGKYVTGDVKVAAIPQGIADIIISVDSDTGKISASPLQVQEGYIKFEDLLSSSYILDTPSEYTFYPGDRHKILISKGKFLTQDVELIGDESLVGENILAGKSIFGVQGTATYATYYTGTSAPDKAGLANEGDFYFRTVS